MPIKPVGNGTKTFRYTFAQSEEQRIKGEINPLKRLRAPFGARTSHISKNAQVRIIEQLAQEAGVPHPRLLKFDHFTKIKLPGWTAMLQGIYQYYRNLTPKDYKGGTIIDFMLDRLGFERIKDLPVSKQIDFLREHGPQIIKWEHLSNAAKRELIYFLAREAEVPHPRLLNTPHFNKIKVPEIELTLTGLYKIYTKTCSDQGKVVDTLLDDIEIPTFDSLPWQQQLKYLKTVKFIQWERIPSSTQLKLLKILRERMPQKNEIPCPHLRALLTPEIKIVIEEIGKPLSGLRNHYYEKMPKDYKGSAIDYMLDQLGVKKFEKLSYEMQCLCLRYDIMRPWERVPEATILRFFDRVKELNSLPHLRHLGEEYLRNTTIPEINQTLMGLYGLYQRKQAPQDKRTVTDYMLDELGVPPFSEMPFEHQLQWAQSRKKIYNWGRLSPSVISHYFDSLVVAAELSSREEIRARHFRLLVEGRESPLFGLYVHLRHRAARSGSRLTPIQWALQEYDPLSEQIRAKRRHGGALLDLEEKHFLINSAQAGSREAMDHLLFFYRPIIHGCIKRAVAKVGWRRKTEGELFQVGQIGLSRLIQRFDRRGVNFETYVISSLTWTIRNEIVRDTGVIHRPPHYLDEVRKIFKARAALRIKLNRNPMDEELAKELGMSVEKLRIKLDFYSREQSLQSPLFDEGEATLESRIPDFRIIRPDAAYEEKELKEILEEAIEGSGLKENEKFALRKHRLEGHTLEEVGEMLGVSREWIRQLEASAIEKIKKRRYSRKLRKLISE
jgi:RNA polymerase sigma factor (sigma-70 family)